MTHHVVMFSGGVGSWATAKVVRENNFKPGDEMTLLFADTLMEDEDLYRFLRDAHGDVGGALVTLTDGRTPWEVFHDKRYLGNTRVDPCSYYLKRLPLRRWLDANLDPRHTIVYLGIDWTEAHRFTKAQKYWDPWMVQAPLIDDRPMDKAAQLEWLARCNIPAPRLYELGFPHNNCGGFCVKAGQGHFKMLLEKMPERYAEHEAKEQELREYLGKDVAILRDRRGGTVTPLTLQSLRSRLEDVDDFDIGGCNCVNPDAEIDSEIESM